MKEDGKALTNRRIASRKLARDLTDSELSLVAGGAFTKVKDCGEDCDTEAY